ncbi:MAG: 4Fe-4S dicluster domain-containing protein [Desulfobacter sp.]|nr:MAG: 4Fe-4S dicluster domain-containing protein [Desulfobacter sp.]
MTSKINPDIMKLMGKYGAQSATACFNCGNCTAVCSLSTENTPFPRKVIRYLQLGLTDKLAASPEPWLCYYCGDCSATCPRDADPGEVMMGLRRYLTSIYDWTGISKRFYTSKVFEVASILVVALAVGLGFYFFHGPMLTDRVALNVFAPNTTIEILDLIMLAVLSFFLLSNAFRLARGVMGNPRQYMVSLKDDANPAVLIFGVPLKTYMAEMKEFIIHFFTQKRFNSCEGDDDPESGRQKKILWINHLLIMSGYSIIFLMVVGGIRWFQRDEILSIFNPIRFLGYYATFAILYGTTYAMIGRLKKTARPYSKTHSTDWAFLILLWLTTFSGILIHFTRLLEMPLTTYYLYVIHLMIAVPMLVIEVPFAKWTHQLYRPLVLFLMKVRHRALAG